MTELPGIRADRIGADIEGLAALTEPDRPWTRRAFTPMFAAGREWLTRRFEAAGLQTRIDAAGNLIGLRHGARPEAGTIMIGSHSDTVPGGGRFDGIAGVVAGLEVARALADRGVTLAHNLEIVDFLAEEVSPFGLACIGSGGLVGALTPAILAREADGVPLGKAIARAGGRPEALGEPVRTDLAAFLELHIEQGPVLEAEGLALGVVTAIAGVTRIEIVVEGRPDHAGTAPMGHRHDALAAAARMVLAVEEAANGLAAGPAHFVATVGEFTIEPNVANVVPARVRMLVDARAERRADMERFVTEIGALALEIASETGTGIAPPVTISDGPPSPLDAGLRAMLAEAAEALGAKHRAMASGAGHDAASLAQITRAAMLFIPCRDGRSHTPEEFAETADIALGAAVLAETILRLDRSG